MELGLQLGGGGYLVRGAGQTLLLLEHFEFVALLRELF